MTPGKHAAPVAPDAGSSSADGAATAGTPDVGAHVAADISIVAGNPTPEEVAAVTAVLTAVLEEISDELGRTHSAAPSAWARSQRSVRGPHQAGPGAWRGFSA